jgi:uncharacterized membrane protein YhaH (DUF805 family)
MNFKQAIVSGINNYVNFSDRAPRSEYWYWVLFVFLVDLAAIFLDAMLMNNTMLFYWTAALALLLPSLGVSVRRLHDLDRSGWWMLVAFVPLIGGILLLYWFCQKGTSGSNQYGPDPL